MKCNQYSFDSRSLIANGLTPSQVSSINSESSRKQYLQRGYLYVPQFIPRSFVLELRDKYFSLWNQSGDKSLDYGTLGHPAFEFVRSLDFYKFTNMARLKELADILLNGETQLLKRRILRHFYKGLEKSSRAHIDFVYLDKGSTEFLTFWIPIGDCSIETGGLLYLRDSHLLNYKKIKNQFPGSHPWLSADLNKVSRVTNKYWLGQNFSAGDVVAHHPRNIHASLNCQTSEHRLSIDLRFVRKESRMDPRWSNFWRADDGF